MLFTDIIRFVLISTLQKNDEYKKMYEILKQTFKLICSRNNLFFYQVLIFQVF